MQNQNLGNKQKVNGLIRSSDRSQVEFPFKWEKKCPGINVHNRFIRSNMTLITSTVTNTR